MAILSSFICSDSDVDSDVAAPELLALMKEKLPGYMQKRFLASGFDTEEATAVMDVDSVTTMERFVEKRFSHDPSMYSKFLLTSSESSFEFPPGHKALISRFIKQVRENYNTTFSIAWYSITRQ